MDRARLFKNGKFDQIISGKETIKWWINTVKCQQQARDCWERLSWSEQLTEPMPETYRVEF